MCAAFYPLVIFFVHVHFVRLLFLLLLRLLVWFSLLSASSSSAYVRYSTYNISFRSVLHTMFSYSHTHTDTDTEKHTGTQTRSERARLYMRAMLIIPMNSLPLLCVSLSPIFSVCARFPLFFLSHPFQWYSFDAVRRSLCFIYFIYTEAEPSRQGQYRAQTFLRLFHHKIYLFLCMSYVRS